MSADVILNLHSALSFTSHIYPFFRKPVCFALNISLTQSLLTTFGMSHHYVPLALLERPPNLSPWSLICHLPPALYSRHSTQSDPVVLCSKPFSLYKRQFFTAISEALYNSVLYLPIGHQLCLYDRISSYLTLLQATGLPYYIP